MKLDKIKSYIEQIKDSVSEEFLAGANTVISLFERTEELDKNRTKLLKLLSIKAEILIPKPKYDPIEYRKQYHKRVYKPKGYKNRVRVQKICLTCKETFLGLPGQKYCKPNHSPTVKERKRLDKRRFNVDSKPPWQSWEEISRIYENKPEGAHVDHIIPLNHPDVCGLHVPWNLQYLSPQENNYKSNKWDGTYDNISWKNEYLNREQVIKL